MINKQNLGQFNTKNDVWFRPQVEEFIKNCGCKNIIDPFAGAGDLFLAVKHLNFEKFIGFDIDSQLNWPINNSLIDVPYYENTLVLTNPPYIGKNSAKRNNLDCYKYFSDNYYIDIYQLALEKVLVKYEKAVFIIPETYLLQDVYKEYLTHITVLEDNPFVDTDCPVCVACFDKTNKTFLLHDVKYNIYKNNEFIFVSTELHIVLKRLLGDRSCDIIFNVSDGNIGLRAIDGIDPDDRIRFCLPDELEYNVENIKESSRAITAIDTSNYSMIDYEIIKKANAILEELRKETKDVVFAPFKNNNKLGVRRRRLDFGIARKILDKVLTGYER